MKKIKKISIRISEEDYNILFYDYIWEKENNAWTNWINHNEIKTFSDYVRLIISKGTND